MKRFLTLLIVLFILEMNVMSQTKPYMVASATYAYDAGSSMLADSTFFSYGNIDRHYDTTLNTWNYNKADQYTFTNSQPQSTKRIINQYNNEQRVTVNTNEILDNVQGWVPDQRFSYSYDANGNITVTQIERHLTISPEKSRVSTIYNTANQRIKSIWSYWDGGSVYEDLQHRYYKYNVDNLVDTTIDESLRNGVWVITQHYIYKYTNGLVTEMLQELYMSGKWYPRQQVLYSYDGNNNMLSYEVRNYNGSVWDNQSMYVYEYNSDNNVVSATSKIWDNTAYVNYMKTAYTYNMYGQLQTVNDSTWNNSDMMYTWQANNFHTLYHYSNEPIRVNQATITNQVNIYPIPASDQLIINCRKKMKQIKMYDMSGRLINTFVAAAPSVTLDISNIAKGNYIINIQVEDEELSKPVTIVH